MASSTVTIRHEKTVIPTYQPHPANKNPMFLERRVYQGSSGRVYPMPCVERFDEKKTDRAWDAVYIENDFVEVMILPELGGRIHAAKDKTNGYDLLYRNNVIKPALVGLAGAWASGGIEFNWPQHHRPSTFMPTDVHVEEHTDGSKTIWMSEHDPLVRMKGMHGVCIHPGKSVIEVKVRAYNRTNFVQTFLWWANVATEVHEAYQSFFPTDVTHVADHARGSTSTYPYCTGTYYGVDYATRAKNGVPQHEVPPDYVPPHCLDKNLVPPELAGLDYQPNDLSWYANIPVPTSYMCLGSKDDFFGGYDHRAKAGLVHIANRHISPGKKQWTWGNHPFGYAWDSNLTDPDENGKCRPYIELMAGVYTDNQPDFAFLQPGETKTWSQYWYPLRDIGPTQKATLDGALSLTVKGKQARIGALTTQSMKAMVKLTAGGKEIYARSVDLSPQTSLVDSVNFPARSRPSNLRLSLHDKQGHELLAYQPDGSGKVNEPEPATEPPAPQDIKTNDELYITGLHLAQYRHPTRMSEPYYEEALRRDPDDLRCSTAMGLVKLHAGDFDGAEVLFRKAVARATRRNPNPYDGEPHYCLGLALRFRADLQIAKGLNGETLLEDAYAAFYKATWNQAWQSAGFVALAEIDCRRSNWSAAVDHLDRALRVNTDHLWARDLKAIVLNKLGRDQDAQTLLKQTLALDPLDWQARRLTGAELSCDTQTRLDLVHDLARAGFYVDAVSLIDGITCDAGTEPTVQYTLAWLYNLLGESKLAMKARTSAEKASPDYCFPSRHEEVVILSAAMDANPKDARALYYLGCLLYDRKRQLDAIKLWETSAKLDPTYPIVWRNLGIGYFNHGQRPEAARKAYDKAVELAPRDARVLFERDLLWKRLGTSAAKRLSALDLKLDLVRGRDDLSVEFCDLLNQAGRHEDALNYLASRRFQPWEGGEGLARGQHVRTQLALGRLALANGDAAEACEHFQTAPKTPPNLGESKHLLANQADVYYWLGCAYDALGKKDQATEAWTIAARFRGDFQERAVRTYSELTYYSALSLAKLGRKSEARNLFKSMKLYAKQLFKEEAKVYYFATSLPARLLFDNMQRRQETTALFIEAQASLGLGDKASAKKLLKTVLTRDPAHALARDLLAGIA